jgi:xanthosine utilization system XapX-like protein
MLKILVISLVAGFLMGILVHFLRRAINSAKYGK